jgi:Protein of unknown function (DUF3375)
VIEADEDVLAGLQNLPHLSLDVLRGRVEDCLTREPFVTLTAVLRRYPAEHGMPEVLGYLILAASDPARHYFPPGQSDEVESGGGAWRVPRALFCRETVGTPTSTPGAA